VKKQTIKDYEKAYEKGGQQAVFDLADKNKLPYSYCKHCENETPTIDSCCALCSQGKDPNERRGCKILWTPYLATAYAEGFCEGEDATFDETMYAWAYIIKTGLWRSLQGWYGRNVNDLINNNIISPTGVINWTNVDKQKM